MPMGPGGQRPSPEQIQMMQRQIAAEAQKAGMSVPDFVEHVKKQQMMRMQQQRAGGAPPGTSPASAAPGTPGAAAAARPGAPGRGAPRPGQGKPQPITPGPPNPKALAVANFLKSQELKPRTCILNGERKDMFKGELPPPL